MRRTVVVLVLCAGCGDAAMPMSPGVDAGPVPTGPRVVRWAYEVDEQSDVIQDFDFRLSYEDDLLRSVTFVHRREAEEKGRYTYVGRQLASIQDVDDDEVMTVESYTYDGTKLASATARSGTQVTTYRYEQDRPVGIRLARSSVHQVVTTTLAYDAAQRLTGTTEEDWGRAGPRAGRACRYTYDGPLFQSYHCSRSNFTNTATTATHDAMGRLATIGQWTLTYGANGLVESITGRDNARYTFEYETGPTYGFVLAIPEVTPIALYGLDGKLLPTIPILTLERVVLGRF